MLMAPRSMAAQTFVPFFFFKKIFLSKEDRGLDFQISLHVSDQV